MLRLLLMRHAKSDWDAAFGEDHERPLAPRGIAAARRMGRFLTTVGAVPDAVITSTAVRARSTVDLAREAGGWECPVVRTRAFYDSTPQAVRAEIARYPDAAATLLIAGHQPTWSMLLSSLVGGGQMRFSTATVAAVSLPLESWSQIADTGGTNHGRARGELLWLVTPRLLKEAGLG